MTSLVTEKEQELKRVEKFPELSFFSFYMGLNTGNVKRNDYLYDRCKDLINGEYNNKDNENIKKKINSIASEANTEGASKVLRNHLTNVLYASIGLGIKKQACKKCAKGGGRKKQSGGAWNENGEWEGEEDEPTPNDYAMATYDNVMTMVTNVQNSQAVQLANRYLDELPVILEVDEDDSAFVKTGKQGINSAPYIYFSYHLLTLCVYGSYLIRILNSNLLGVEEASPPVYEFKRPPVLMELTDGQSEEKEMSSGVVVYEAHSVWTEEVYPKTDLIDKIKVIDVILNRGTAQDDMKLYLTVAGEMAIERIKDQVVKKRNGEMKKTLALGKEHTKQIKARREATYNMDDWIDRMRYNMDEYTRTINLWEPVDDYATGFSRSMTEQQMKLEYEAKKMTFDIKNQIEDTLKIHSKNTLRAANQVFWSGLFVVGSLGALAIWAYYKKKSGRGGAIRLRPRRAVREITDSYARERDIHKLVFEFDRDEQRWLPISGTRSGTTYITEEEEEEGIKEEEIDKLFLENEDPRYGCPSLAWVSGCNIQGGKRRKKRKTRRKKRRKTRRKSKKSKRRRKRKTKRKRRKRR